MFAAAYVNRVMPYFCLENGMQIYRYVFETNAPMEEVEASLVMAMFAVESLHGEARVRLEASHAFSSDKRSCVINTGGVVGRDLNRIFVGFIQREFGSDSFRVECLDPTTSSLKKTAVA